MQNGLEDLLRMQHTTIQIYGPHGTYKTTLLLQIIRQKIERGARIYLLDVSGNFPIVRLQSQKYLLQQVAVFHPKTLEEEALILDDLAIYRLPSNSVLLIDDIFWYARRKNIPKNFHSSFLLAIIKKISDKLSFPVVITNQGRSFESDTIYPLFQELVLNYLDWHVLFEKEKGSDFLRVSLFEKDHYLLQQEYSIDSSGFIEGLDL